MITRRTSCVASTGSHGAGEHGGEAYVISEYMGHYHHERFHQGIGAALISPIAANDNTSNGDIRCRARLGGLLNFYYREAG